MKKRILLINGCPLLNESIKTHLSENFPEAVIEMIQSLGGFLDRLAEIADKKCPWDIIISEVILPWKLDGEKVRTNPPIPSIQFSTAGFVAHDEFRKRWSNVPWIYFTLMPESDWRKKLGKLGPCTSYTQFHEWEIDQELHAFLENIQERLGGPLVAQVGS